MEEVKKEKQSTKVGLVQVVRSYRKDEKSGNAAKEKHSLTYENQDDKS